MIHYTHIGDGFALYCVFMCLCVFYQDKVIFIWEIAFVCTAEQIHTRENYEALWCHGKWSNENDVCYGYGICVSHIMTVNVTMDIHW